MQETPQRERWDVMGLLCTNTLLEYLHFMLLSLLLHYNSVKILYFYSAIL